MQIKMIRSIFLYAGVLLLLFSAALQAGSHPPGPFGITRCMSYYSAFDYSETSILRIDINWVLFEREQGEYNWPQYIENNLRFAMRNGYDVTLGIRTNQNWATGHPDPENFKPSYPPIDLEEEWNDDFGYSETYYDFVYRVIEKYKPAVHSIFIENEINVRGLWAGTTEEYIRLLATARKAAKDVNPEIRIYDSGISSCAWGLLMARDKLDAGTPIEEVYDFVAGYFETHPDLFFPSAEELRYYLTENLGFLRQKQMVDTFFSMIDGLLDGLNFHFCEGYDYLEGVIQYLRDKLNQHGVSIDRIINNEMSRRNGVFFSGLGEPEYASLVVRKLVLGHVYGIDEIYWFPFTERELLHEKYGLLDDFDNWRPALTTFRVLNTFADREHSLYSADTLGQSVQRVTFTSDRTLDLDLDILWYENGPHDFSSEYLTLPYRLGARAASVYNQYGRLITTEDTGRNLMMDVPFHPLYIKWDYTASGRGITPFCASTPVDSIADMRSAGAQKTLESVSWGEFEPEEGVFDTVYLAGLEKRALDNRITYTLRVNTGKCWATGHPGFTGREPSYPPVDLQEQWSEEFGHSQSYYSMLTELFSTLPWFVDRVMIQDGVLRPEKWAGTVHEYILLLKTAKKARVEAGAAVQFMDSGVPSRLLGYGIIDDMINSGEFGNQQVLHFANGYFARSDESWDSFEELQQYMELAPVQDAVSDLFSYLTGIFPYVNILNIEFEADHWHMQSILRWFEERASIWGFEYDRIAIGSLKRPGILPQGWPQCMQSFTTDMLRSLITARMLGFEDVYFDPFVEPEESDDYIGLIGNDGTWREAAHAYRFLAQKLGSQYTFLKELKPNDPEIVAYSFFSEQDSTTFIAAWWDNGAHMPGGATVRVNLPEEGAILTMYDYLGEPKILYKPQDRNTFALTEIPKYFEMASPLAGFMFKPLD